MAGNEENVEDLKKEKERLAAAREKAEAKFSSLEKDTQAMEKKIKELRRCTKI